MRRPVDAPYTKSSKHGDKTTGHYGKHLGTDYAVPVGRAVKSPVAGTIARQGWSDSVGNYIEINGVDGRLHRLLHLSVRQVATGAKVAEGQQIALSGNTGSNTTGPHVHWDARKGGTGFYDGFNNYVDTETLVTPTPPPAPSQTQTVHLPKTVTTWAAYRVGSAYRKGTSDQVGTLLPKEYGGLTYKIVEHRGDVVVIDTEKLGRVAIWVKGTEAVFGGSPVTPQPKPGLTVTLPSWVQTWAVYKVGSKLRKGTIDQVGNLTPARFRGLTYPIVERKANSVVIDTQSFGRVEIWVKDTDAVIK